MFFFFSFFFFKRNQKESFFSFPTLFNYIHTLLVLLKARNPLQTRRRIRIRRTKKKKKKKIMRYPSSSTSSSAMVALLFFLASSTGIVLGDDSSSSSSSSTTSTSGSDGGAGCTKFSINGSTTPAGYFFARHRFYDFRRIDSHFIAPHQTLSNSTVSKSVNDTSWTDDWNISVKQVSDYSIDSTVSLQFSADNVYIR